MIGLSLSTLLVSFGFAQDIETVNCPLSQPEVSKSGFTYKIFSGTYNPTQDIYYLTAATLTGTADIEIFGGIWSKSSGAYTVSYTVWNAETGVLVREQSATAATYNQYGNYYQSRFSSVAAGRTEGYYNVLPEGMSDLTNQNNANEKYSNQFIDFRPQAADVVLYKSVLSEPVADEFNSYFIANNALYWLSYRFNGLYRISNNIESESYTEMISGSFSGSGSGSYAGSNNGYTEEFSMFGDLAGATSMDPFLGQWQSDPQQIDYVGVSQGSIIQSSSGNFSFNNKVIYPVSFDQTLIHRLFDVVVYLQNDKSFSFRIYPNQSDLAGYVVDVDVFVSSFYLNSGKFVGSTYHNYTGVIDFCGGNFQLDADDDPISSVKCYGCHFANINEVPVNLSSVLWQYDLEFADWRDSMLDMLTAIYNTLTNSTDVPEAVTTANWGNEIKDAEPGTGINNDEVVSVYDNVDEINSSLSSSSEDLHSIIDLFSIGKLIGLVAFALSIGTAIIILGKKKSD